MVRAVRADRALGGQCSAGRACETRLAQHWRGARGAAEADEHLVPRREVVGRVVGVDPDSVDILRANADLEAIEAHSLLRPGSVVVADNVGPLFGAHDYLGYVRGCGRYQCEHREATLEYSTIPDAVEVSTYTP